MYKLKLKNRLEMDVVLRELRHCLKSDYVLKIAFMGRLYKYVDRQRIVSEPVKLTIFYKEYVIRRKDIRRSKIELAGVNAEYARNFLADRTDIGRYFESLDSFVDSVELYVIEDIRKYGEYVHVKCLANRRRLDYQEFLQWVCKIHRTNMLYVKFGNHTKSIFLDFLEGMSLRRNNLREREDDKYVKVYINSIDKLKELLPEMHIEGVYYGASAYTVQNTLEGIRDITRGTEYNYGHVVR